MTDSIFVIFRPSGAGKSKAIGKLNLSDKFALFKLDNVICEHNNEPSISKFYGRVGNPEFFYKTEQAIDILINNNLDKTLVIDVGAGSIDYEKCLDFYSQFSKIYLFADNDTLYKRIQEKNPKDIRTLKEYLDSEFKPHKLSLYNSAEYKIDNSKLTIEQTANEIKRIILNTCS